MNFCIADFNHCEPLDHPCVSAQTHSLASAKTKQEETLMDEYLSYARNNR